MEEEDVEVDQENSETNSAGGNVRIQIYSFRIYIQCILQNPYLTEVHVCISAILWFCIKLKECRIMNTKL